MEVTRVRGQWQVENQIYMGQWFSNVELPPGREGRHTWPGGTSITYDIYIYMYVYMTRVLGNIKLPPPLNFTFNREDQQGF